ncbi:MAG: YihY/virulence factor BrkB family protein [Deltaproteobacteria bacterium]|nr:MAG: YihY/virulence factor BrkB family protein [Deltaproteobacteria bacterium]
MSGTTTVAEKMKHAGRFMRRVLRDFRRNQGLLLSGAIAYYTFLSIVPMVLLAVIVLSHVLAETQLTQVLSVYMDMVIPGYSVTLAEQMKPFLEHRIVVGVVGFLAMLFFSSIAFSMLENAMTLIFFHRFKQRTKRRHLLVSAIIPYLYLSLIALGVIAVSGAIGVIEGFVYRQIVHFGWDFSLEGLTGVLLYLTGLAGEFLILSSIYLVMPSVRVSLRYALIGGLTATVLWELTRRLMIWYYEAISMVNLIYGPIAIAVGALLCIEVAAIIILLGAQVIAELQAGSDGDDHAGEVNM